MRVRYSCDNVKIHAIPSKSVCVLLLRGRVTCVPVPVPMARWPYVSCDKGSVKPLIGTYQNYAKPNLSTKRQKEGVAGILRSTIGTIGRRPIRSRARKPIPEKGAMCSVPINGSKKHRYTYFWPLSS